MENKLGPHVHEVVWERSGNGLDCGRKRPHGQTYRQRLTMALGASAAVSIAFPPRPAREVRRNTRPARPYPGFTGLQRAAAFLESPDARGPARPRLA